MGAVETEEMRTANEQSGGSARLTATEHPVRFSFIEKEREKEDEQRHGACGQQNEQFEERKKERGESQEEKSERKERGKNRRTATAAIASKRVSKKAFGIEDREFGRGRFVERDRSGGFPGAGGAPGVPGAAAARLCSEKQRARQRSHLHEQHGSYLFDQADHEIHTAGEFREAQPGFGRKVHGGVE